MLMVPFAIHVPLEVTFLDSLVEEETHHMILSSLPWSDKTRYDLLPHCKTNWGPLHTRNALLPYHSPRARGKTAYNGHGGCGANLAVVLLPSVFIGMAQVWWKTLEVNGAALLELLDPHGLMREPSWSHEGFSFFWDWPVLEVCRILHINTRANFDDFDDLDDGVAAPPWFAAWASMLHYLWLVQLILQTMVRWLGIARGAEAVTNSRWIDAPATA